MAFAASDPRRGPAAMADINLVPLIDVMRALPVIFIVTAPLLTHAVKLDLPRASSGVNLGPAQKIDFAIDADGRRDWNGQRIDPATSRVPASPPWRRATPAPRCISADRCQRPAARGGRDRRRQRRPDPNRLRQQTGALSEGPVRVRGRRT